MTLRVFAAASLTESFTELGEQFEADHPGTEVELQLRPELRAGRADHRRCTGRRVRLGQRQQHGHGGRGRRGRGPEGLRDEQHGDRRAARTTRARSTGSADLAEPDVKVALCQAQVPCGKVAAEVFANAGLTVKPVTEEVDVKSVLTKVTLGEVDAGVVYVTDVLAAGRQGHGRRDPRRRERLDHLPDRRPRGLRAPGGGRASSSTWCSPTQVRKVLEEAGFQSP